MKSPITVSPTKETSATFTPTFVVNDVLTAGITGTNAINSGEVVLYEREGPGLD